MRPSLLRAGVAAAILALPLGGLAQPGRFRSGVELVHVGVTVLDRNGHVVPNLTADDFELYEDGRKQDIAFFVRGSQLPKPDAASADTGFSPHRLRLGLLFDTSGSMDRDVQLARTAAVRFLISIREAVDITVVDFDTEVRVARYGAAEVPRLIERIRQRRPDGWTTLYDALATYLDGAHDLDGRKVAVLYTDGGDTRSATTFSEALEMLRISDVTLFVLGFLENQSAGVRSTQRMRLMQMAQVTGGEAFFPASIESLDQIYRHIASQIRSQYNLGFTSTNASEDGTWRRLQVRLVGDHPKGLKVRARDGYFARMRMPTPGELTR